MDDQQTLRRFMELSRGSNTQQGTMHILTNVGSFLSRYCGRNMELFNTMQWFCKTIHLKSMDKIESILQCDILVIDVECSIATGTSPTPYKANRSYLQPHHGSPTRKSRKSSQDFNKSSDNDNKANRQELDIRDLLHIIRALGFQGLIVVAYPSTADLPGVDTSTLAPSAADHSDLGYKLQHANAYTDAFHVDMHVHLPFNKKTAKNVIERYESHFLSSL